MQNYLDLLQKLLDEGHYREDRTKVGCYSIFGYQMRFDLSEGFPLMTTKALHLPSIVHELLWFLSGDTNVGYLQKNGVSIWDEWADAKGDLGPVYGKQWRSWGREGIDQIARLMEGLRTDPYGRRHIVTAWNPEDIERMRLPPCHAMVQFFVKDDTISCQLYQRSADVFLGVPFNIASYAILCAMVAHQLGKKPGEFVWTGGDVHLYQNHVNQAKLQLDRAPLPLPRLSFRRLPATIFSYLFEDIEFVDYHPLPNISAPVAV